MKYPIHNRTAFWALYLIDTLLTWCIPSKKSFSHTPQRILLCNTAHLGDVILTTSLLPVLRVAYPDATIGVLVGSWSKQILEVHPFVHHIHVIDHWKVSRKPENKIWRYLKMRRQVLKELRAVRYDWAIDCGLHFPNMAPLLWQAKIPVRSGFITAGFAPLLTHAYSWNPQENRSVVESYFSLLPALQHFRSHLRPCIPFSERKPTGSIVIHMGSGNPQKNWPESHWIDLCKRLTADGAQLVFTGKGEAEHQSIERVRSHLPASQNLCNALSWEQFTSAIQNASLLIATDTSAGHVAAAAGTPSVLLYTGIHPNALWKPYGGAVTTLTHPTSCSPCFKGCRAMTCLRSVSPAVVYEAAKESLRKPH